MWGMTLAWNEFKTQNFKFVDKGHHKYATSSLRDRGSLWGCVSGDGGGKLAQTWQTFRTIDSRLKLAPRAWAEREFLRMIKYNGGLVGSLRPKQVVRTQLHAREKTFGRQLPIRDYHVWSDKSMGWADIRQNIVGRGDSFYLPGSKVNERNRDLERHTYTLINWNLPFTKRWSFVYKAWTPSEFSGANSYFHGAVKPPPGIMDADEEISDCQVDGNRPLWRLGILLEPEYTTMFSKSSCIYLPTIALIAQF